MAATSDRFNAKIDITFAAAQKAIRNLGYKIDSIDKAGGLICFKTGMSLWSFAGQEMSLMLIDNADGTTEVSVSGRRNQNGVVIQVFDWGEANGIARRVLNETKVELGKVPKQVSAKVEPQLNADPATTRSERECPYCAELILVKAKVCKHCGRAVDSVSEPIDEIAISKAQVATSAQEEKSSEPKTASQRIGLNCSCGAKLKVKDSMLWKSINCPKCHTTIRVTPWSKSEREPGRPSN